MIWLIEHTDGEVRISDENRSVIFQATLRQAASHLAYCLDEIRVLKAESTRQHEEIEMLRRHNADLANEVVTLKTPLMR